MRGANDAVPAGVVPEDLETEGVMPEDGFGFCACMSKAAGCPIKWLSKPSGTK